MRSWAGIFRSINNLISTRSIRLSSCFPKVIASSYGHSLLSRNADILSSRTSTFTSLSSHLEIIEFTQKNVRNFYTSPYLLLSKGIHENPRNQNIVARRVLLIDTNGEEVGTMVFKEALYKAKEKSLHLVQMQKSQGLMPMICKLVSPKMIFDSEKKAKHSSHGFKLKVLTLTGRIAPQDLKWKIKKIWDFLENGHSVKLSITRKPYQKISREEKMEIIQKVVEEVKDVGVLDGEPKMIGSLALRCNFKPVAHKSKTE